MIIQRLQILQEMLASGSIIDLGVKLDKGELSTNVVNNKVQFFLQLVVPDV